MPEDVVKFVVLPVGYVKAERGIQTTAIYISNVNIKNRTTDDCIANVVPLEMPLSIPASPVMVTYCAELEMKSAEALKMAVPLCKESWPIW